LNVIFAYIAGLLTLINPCVLPVLPIVMASALQVDRRAPLLLAAGMSLSFVTLGVGVAALGRSLGLTEDTVAHGAALVMVAFGLIMLTPMLAGRFSTATAGFSARADAQMTAANDKGLIGQFFGGILLGAVWSPCIGPTLGAAIAMASQGQNLIQATATMVGFAAGVSSLIIALAYGARSWFQRNQVALRSVSKISKPLMGITFVLVGVVLWFDLQRPLEIWFLDHMPFWLQDLSVVL
jgi:cytochrome c-type biogenesis protein